MATTETNAGTITTDLPFLADNPYTQPSQNKITYTSGSLNSTPVQSTPEATSIAGARPLNIPDSGNSTASTAGYGAIGATTGMNKSLQKLIDDQTAQELEAQKNVNSSTSKIQESIDQLAKKGEAQIAAEKEAGIGDKKQLYNNLTTEYQTRQLAYNSQYQSILNSPGLTREQAVDRIDELTRQHSFTLTDLGIRQAIAGNQYNTAQELVNHKIDLQFGDLKDKIDLQMKFLDQNRQDLSNAQQKKLELRIETDRRDYEDKTNKAKKLEDTKLQVLSEAAKYGADQVTQKKIQDAKTPEEAYQAAGTYLSADFRRQLANDKLDNEYKRAQIDNIQSEIAKRKADNQPIVVDTSGRIVTGRVESGKINKEIVTNDAYKALTKAKDSLQFLTDFENTFNKTGATSAVFSPRQNAALKAKYNTTILNLKEFFNLGVLNGPDETILRGVIPDPTNKSAALTIGSLGIYKPSAATKAGIENMKKQIEQTIDERYKNLKTQYSAYSPTAVTSLGDLDRVYVDQKAKLNPEVQKLKSENPDLSDEDIISILGI